MNISSINLQIDNMAEGLKYDNGKIKYNLIPIECIEDLAKILTMGSEKYADNSWQQVENGEERYFAALMRHLVASRKGDKIDEESGLSHLAHAMCNVVFLLWLEKNKVNDEKKAQDSCYVCH
jgi:hypothetical protein